MSLSAAACGVVVAPQRDGDSATPPDATALDRDGDADSGVQVTGGRLHIVSRWTEALTDSDFVVFGGFWDPARSEVTETGVGQCQLLRIPPTTQWLSAGNISLAWGSMRRVLVPDANNVYPISFTPPVPSDGQPVTIEGGSASVPSFSATLALPPVPVILDTGPDLPRPLPDPLVIRWRPESDPSLEIRVLFTWVDADNIAYNLSCISPAAAGRFEAPAAVMAMLRPLPRRRAKVALGRSIRVPIGRTALNYRVERTGAFFTFE